MTRRWPVQRLLPIRTIRDHLPREKKFFERRIARGAIRWAGKWQAGRVRAVAADLRVDRDQAVLAHPDREQAGHRVDPAVLQADQADGDSAAVPISPRSEQIPTIRSNG